MWSRQNIKTLNAVMRRDIGSEAINSTISAEQLLYKKIFSLFMKKKKKKWIIILFLTAANDRGFYHSR